jgi:dTDP-glucose 4,6-dehydratase
MSAIGSTSAIKGQLGEVYNIGGHCERTNLELTHALLQAVGKPTSLIQYVQDRLGHDRRYAIDCTKIERDLGWRPAVAFEEGLRQTVAWYRNNMSWVAKLKK